MSLLSQTKYFLEKTGLRPSKARGQNFCIDENVIEQMVGTARILPNDTVLEVGPGFGFLTLALIQKAGQVIAVELDRKLAELLIKMQESHKNLEIIQEDILRFKSETLKDYKIVANLPYSITAAFLKKFLTAANQPKTITLLLQSEVAERICARPGQMSLLAIAIQLYGRPKIVAKIDRSSFWPVPKVDSAILQIDGIAPFPYPGEISEKKFWQVVRSGFCAKRKQLKNNLASSLHWSPEKVSAALVKIGLDPRCRAQEIAIGQWLQIAKKLMLTRS